MSKISIVVPIYNVEKYIETCLNSLLNQSFEDFDILAISDGSPDNSMKIVERFAKKDKRVKAIYKENGGYGSVLEYAISSIKSKYFLVCDPDDWLEKNALEKLYSCAEKFESDLVVADKYDVFTGSDDKVYSKVMHKNYPVKANIKCENKELYNFSFMILSPHSKLYKTDLARNITFPHNVSHTDAILYLIYLNNISSAVYIDQPFSYYLIDRPGNTATEAAKKNYSLKTFNATITVFNSIYEQLKNSPVSSIIVRLYVECRGLLAHIYKLDNKKDYNIAYRQVVNLMDKLEPYKDDIKYYLNYMTTSKKSLKKFLIDLYYCKLTKKIAVRIYQKLV